MTAGVVGPDHGPTPSDLSSCSLLQWRRERERERERAWYTHFFLRVHELNLVVWDIQRSCGRIHLFVLKSSVSRRATALCECVSYELINRNSIQVYLITR